MVEKLCNNLNIAGMLSLQQGEAALSLKLLSRA